MNSRVQTLTCIATLPTKLGEGGRSEAGWDGAHGSQYVSDASLNAKQSDGGAVNDVSTRDRSDACLVR